MSEVYLKKASLDDINILFEWVNDDEVRKNSFNSKKIGYEDHKQWYKNCLEDVNIEIFILCIDDTPIGQIRINYDGVKALIGYSIDKNFRGRGFGTSILKLIEEVLVIDKPNIQVLIGNVKVNNIASISKFEKNGYEKENKKNGNCNYYMFQKKLGSTKN